MKKNIFFIGLIILSFSLSTNGQITIDGAFADWSGISVLGDDATGDGSTGWDFDNIYVTDDATNVYVRVEMASSGAGSNSLYLFISVDPQNEPTTRTGLSNGWWTNGYDFMVQYYAPNWTLFRYNGDGSSWVWEDMGQNGVHVWTTDNSYDDVEIALAKSVLDNPNISGYVSPTQISVYTIVDGYAEVAGRDGSHGGYLYTLLSPLPVELTSFTAVGNGNEVVLNWQTATEVNNYGFEVERCVAQISNLCNNWQKIGFIEGHGNSNSPKDYTFTDTQTFEVFQNLEGFNGIIQYRLKQINIDGNFEYSDVVEVEINSETPTEYKLSQNYPNPFNPSTVISYSIPRSIRRGEHSVTQTTLKVYDILGNEVATLVNERQNAGNYEVKFNAKNLSSGIYYYRLKSGSFVESKKMILLK